MKKLLLLLTLLVSFGGMVHAEKKSVTLNASYFGISGTSYATKDKTVDGITFATHAAGELGMNKGKGCYLAVTGNTNNYTIESVTINFSAVGANGEISLFKNNKVFTKSTATTGVAAIGQSSLNALATYSSSNFTSTSTDYTTDINDIAFGYVYTATSGNQFKISSIVVKYDTGGEQPDPGKTSVTLGYEPAEATITVGDAWTAPTFSISDEAAKSAVEYTSSNTGLLTVATDGTITLVDDATGTATISASIPSTDATYSSNTATYKLTVKPTGSTTDQYTWLKELPTGDFEGYIVNKDNKKAWTGAVVSGKGTGVDITFTADGSTIATGIENVTPVQFIRNIDGKYAIKSGNKYLAGNSGNTSVSLQNQENYLSLSIDEYGDASILLAGTRYFRYYTGGDFRCYTTSNGLVVQIYAKTDATPKPETYNHNFQDLTLEVEKTAQIALGDSHPEISYSYTKDGIVSINDNGVVTALAVGSTEVTASWGDDTKWAAGSAKFNVTVKAPLKDPELSFRHAEIIGKLGVGIAAQAAHHTSNGEITYSSSDETVVKVNSRTGMIIPANVFKVGEAVITATIAETDVYRSATATYNVKIEAPETGNMQPAGGYTFDFSITPENGGGYGMYQFNAGNTSSQENQNKYEKDRESMTDNNGAKPVYVITSEPVTLTFGEDSQYRWFETSGDGYVLRFYSKASMTLTVPDSYSIEKITVNTISYNKGAYIKANVGTWDAANKQWLAADDNTRSVTLTNDNNSGYVQFPTMTVILKKTGTDKNIADLKFAQRVYNTTVGTTTAINKVTHAEGLPKENIVYTVDNLTDGDYMIDATGDELMATVHKPGVYTLRAKSLPTDNLLPGVAILRLNVFPQLAMTVDGNEPTTNEDGVVLPVEGGKISLDGIPSTVQVYYSLNSEEAKVYDGTPIEFTDDATLTYHMVYAETEEYRHTTTVNVLVTPAKPICDTAEGTNVSEGDILTFSSKEGTTLYYKVEIRQPAQAAAHRAPALDGWTSAGGNTYSYAVPALNDGEIAVVTTKAVKGNLESEETAYGVNSSGITTGVEAIEAEGNEAAEVEWFTLQGVRVENPAQGLYIRRQGNKVEKVVVK